jgi:DNA helicase IV
VSVLSATEAKGLEWDATVLVDAAGIAAESHERIGAHLMWIRLPGR